MPRLKGVPVSHRTKMGQARAALRALPPEQREELRYKGIGPGDSYIGMWKLVNYYRRLVDELEGRAYKGLSMISTQEREELRGYLDQVGTLYGKLLVHEKPKLQSVQIVGGDQAHPIIRDGQFDVTGEKFGEFPTLGLRVMDGVRAAVNEEVEATEAAIVALGFEIPEQTW
jgi:hypothetical protein